MNKIQKSNLYTFIVQAEKIVYTYPDGETILRPMRPHFFRTCDEALKFFDRYVDVLQNDKTIRRCDVASRYSVCTEIPYVAYWAQ